MKNFIHFRLFFVETTCSSFLLLFLLVERRSQDDVLTAAVVFGKVVLFDLLQTADVEIVEVNAVVDGGVLREGAADDADPRVGRNRVGFRAGDEDEEIVTLPHVFGELLARNVVIAGFEVDRGLFGLGEITDDAPAEHLDRDLVVVPGAGHVIGEGHGAERNHQQRVVAERVGVGRNQVGSVALVVAQFQVAVLAVAVGDLLPFDRRGREPEVFLGRGPVVDRGFAVGEARVGLAVLQGREIIAHAGRGALVDGDYPVVVQFAVGGCQNQHARAPRVVARRRAAPVGLQGYHAKPRLGICRRVIHHLGPRRRCVVFPRRDKVDVGVHVEFGETAFHADDAGVDRLFCDRVRVDLDRFVTIGVRMRFTRRDADCRRD